jgi:hypothetical protein
MLSINLVYQELVCSFPPEYRSLANELPYRLGLCATPEDSWEGFVQLEPNRDLPYFVAQHPREPEQFILPSERLALFHRAHMYGGFNFLLSDRLADQQVTPTRALCELQKLLFSAWSQSLHDASLAGEFTQIQLQTAQQRWQIAVQREQAALHSKEITLANYIEIVHDKLSWIRTSAICLLFAAKETARIPAFCRAHSLLLLSLQCLDDADDQREDLITRGCSIPQALNLPPQSLIRASPKIARLAADIAREGGFLRLAMWLDARAHAVDHPIPSETSLQNEMAAFVLSEFARAHQVVL